MLRRIAETPAVEQRPDVECGGAAAPASTTHEATP